MEKGAAERSASEKCYPNHGKMCSGPSHGRHGSVQHRQHPGVFWWTGGHMFVDVGTSAPDFTLVNQDRESVSLRDYRGRPVVLAFFPGAFSDTCTKELCTFRDQMGLLNQARAQVLGISVDTFFALKAFQADQGLTFPLLCDFNKEVIRLYGVFNDDMIGLKGIAKRAVFVLDQHGTVRYREILDDARNEPDYGRVLSTVADLAM
jgi:peroxiredoxin